MAQVSPSSVASALRSQLISLLTPHEVEQHSCALAQLRVISRSVPIGHGLHELVFHVWGRQPTMALFARYAKQPSQAGAVCVTLAGTIYPLMLHHAPNSSYVHSHILVSVRCHDEVDPATQASLLLADGVSPFARCLWVGPVEQCATGYCLPWTKGPASSGGVAQLPTWVCDRVRPNTMLALVTGFQGRTFRVHYTLDAAGPFPSTAASPDLQLVFNLWRVQNQVCATTTSQHAPASAPGPSALPGDRPFAAALSAKPHPPHKRTLATSVPTPAATVPLTTATPMEQDHLPPDRPSSPQPHHWDKRQEVGMSPQAPLCWQQFPALSRPPPHPSTPSRSASTPSVPRGGSRRSSSHKYQPVSLSAPVPAPRSPFLSSNPFHALTPDVTDPIPEEVMADVVSAAQRSPPSPSSPVSAQVLQPPPSVDHPHPRMSVQECPGQELADTYGAGLDNGAEEAEDATDACAAMRAVLDARVDPQLAAHRGMPIGTTLPPHSMEAVGVDDVPAWVAAWLSTPLPRRELMVWVEGCGLPPRMMSPAFRAIVSHFSQQYSRGIPVDLRYRGYADRSPFASACVELVAASGSPTLSCHA